MKVTLRRIVGYLFIVGALVMLAIAVAPSGKPGRLSRL